MVDDKDDKGSARQCKRKVVPGDRLCSTHQRHRSYINSGRYVITLSKKGTVANFDKHGFKHWPKYVIGKVFNSWEDARLWSRLNSTLIWAIPDVKSYCIEPMRNVIK